MVQSRLYIKLFNVQVHIHTHRSHSPLCVITTVMYIQSNSQILAVTISHSNHEVQPDYIYRRKRGVLQFLNLEIPRRNRCGLSWLGISFCCVAHVAVAVGETICSAVGVAIRMSIRRVSVHRRGARVPTEVLSVLSGTIASAPHATLLSMLHLRLVGVFVIHVMAQQGQEVHVEAEDVEAVEECYDPLKHSRNVPDMHLGAHAERDAHADFDNDEGELDPEGNAQDGVLAIVDSQYDVAEDEDTEENVVELGMPPGVKDAKKDQAGGANDGGEGRAC
jgi:hypothetical protein